MKFMATADTDVGIVKEINQDSLLIKHASGPSGEILMAVVCDGMGGLSKGELASATVIRAFSRWFDEELPFELEQPDLEIIGGKWERMLMQLNMKIMDYCKRVNVGLEKKITMGTTFSGILFVGDEYVIAHVGDTRIYQISSGLKQLTEDQTFVAQQIKAGKMTPEQARLDKRRNLLLQCVGASKNMRPEIIRGKTERGTFMICSDGFRHEITNDEICQQLSPINLVDKQAMHERTRKLIELVKSRRERDNISAVVIKVS